jgi:iron complex outermembrane receptor protein
MLRRGSAPGNLEFRLTTRLVLAIAFLTTLLFLPAFAMGQSSRVVTGKVTDPQNAAVAKARVGLIPRQRPADAQFTTTDDQGRFSFSNVAAGDYLISVDASGFARAVRSEIEVTDTGATDIDVQLEVAGVSAEVVVTASGTAQTVDEVSKAVTVVDDQQIQARDEHSVADTLATVPGLRVQRLGGPGRLASIKTRGLRNQDTAVLLDGWRLRDSTAITGDASSFLGDLATTDLDRIEVLRGSGSSLYGTNAIGGVVNLVTAEGGGPFRGNVLLEGGGLGMFRGRAQFSGGTADDRLIFSAGVQHLNFSRGVDGDDAARNTSGQGRILYRFNSKTTLSGYLYATDAFVQLNNSPSPLLTATAPGETEAIALSNDELARYASGTPISALQLNGANFIPDANDPDNSQATHFFAGAIRFVQRPTDRFSYTLSYSGVRTTRSNRNGPGGVGSQSPSRTDYEGTINTFNGRTDLVLGRNNVLTAGYEFEHERFFNNNIQPAVVDNSNVRAAQRSNTFFAQDQISLLNDRLQFSAGFRAQWFHLDQPEFAPAASAPYQNLTVSSPPTAYTGDGSVSYLLQNRSTKLRAHVGNGYRVPSLYERFGTFYSSAFCAYCVYGDPLLKPERSISVDGGIDQSLAGGKVRLSGTYFYTRLQQTIDFFDGLFPQPDPYGRTFGGYFNTPGRIARGVEISADASPTRFFDIFASYTFTNADERKPLEPSVVTSLSIPTHQFMVVANQRIGSRWAFNESLVARSSHLFPFFVFDPNTFIGGSRIFRFSGTALVEAGGSYTWPLSDRRSVRFFGRVENLLDRQYYENGFRMPGVTAKGGAAFQF